MFKVTIITIVLRFLNLLPDVIVILLGKLLAKLLLLIPNRRQQRARANLKKNLPGLSANQYEKLLREHLLHRTLGIVEAGNLWFKPIDKLLHSIVQVNGWEHLQNAHAKGKGVIVAVPHFGAWELTGLYLSAQLDNTAILYKAPSNLSLKRLIETCRGRAGAELLSADGNGIRGLLRCLKSSGYIGILPDQRPQQGDGCIAPLFETPVLTMTLLVRMAQKTGAQIVFAGCERIDDASKAQPQGVLPKLRYKLHVLPAIDAIYHCDESKAITAMNQMVEKIAVINLPQYQWSYNRDNSRLP